MSKRLATFALVALAAISFASSAAELKPWTGGASPGLALKDVAGKEHRLDDYRGRVVVINFWATWCEPCRQEMPSLGRLKAQMADVPFAILAVDLGESEARVKAFLEKTPIDLPVLLDRDSATAKAWKVRMLPTTLVLDPDSRIRYIAIGDLDWSAPEIERTLRALQSSR